MCSNVWEIVSEMLMVVTLLWENDWWTNIEKLSYTKTKIKHKFWYLTASFLQFCLKTESSPQIGPKNASSQTGPDKGMGLGWGWNTDNKNIYFQGKKKKENSDMRAFCNVHWILDNSIIFHRSLSDPLQASFQLNAYPTVIFLRYQKSYKFPNSVKYTKKVFPRKEKLGGYNKSCQRKTCLSGLSQSDR